MHRTYKHLPITTILNRTGYKLCEPLRTPRYRINRLSVRSTWLLQEYIEYAYGRKDTSDTIEHYRANQDFGRTLVIRQILSVLDSYKLVWWLVTVKREGYGPGVTSPTHRKDKLLPRHLKISLDFKKIVLVIWGIIPRCYILDSVIVNWSLNFEDEISFKRGRV